MEKSVLAVDIGTSSLKAALVDARGTVLADARCRFPAGPRVPRHWIEALSEAVRLIAGREGERSTLAAVTVSGNGPTLVGVDSRNRTGDLFLWNDPVPGSPRPPANRTGSPSLFIPRISAFRTLFPACWEGARWLLSGPEFLIWYLTGEAVTILPEERYRDAYWTEEALVAAGIDGSKLPPFILSGAVAGVTATPDGCACRAGGSSAHAPAVPLPAGIPVIAGGPDFTVALVGTGTLEPGKACDRAGTSEGLNVCTASRVLAPGIRTLPAVRSPLWNASYLLPETGASFHAWRQKSGLGSRSYPEIMREIESSPILPPKGTPLHPGREVVEGIGFSVRRGIDALRGATGLDPVFSLSGGQARNDTWNRMKADITGATFALTATPDGELMGDAVIGFTALGEYCSIAEAASRMVRTIRLYRPDATVGPLYTEKYLQHEDLLDS